MSLIDIHNPDRKCEVANDDLRVRLRSYRDAKRRYEAAKLLLEECESLLTSISIDYSAERVQRTPDMDRLGDLIDRLSRLRRECIWAAAETVECMQDVADLIDRVGSGTLHEILTRRYIRGQKWELIAEEMHYSLNGIHKLHRKALDILRK